MMGLVALERGPCPLFVASAAEGCCRVLHTQGLALSEWMKSHLRVDDDVTLVVDVGSREHGLLAHLLRGGTLPLADQVLVHWHTQHLVSPIPTSS